TRRSPPVPYATLFRSHIDRRHFCGVIVVRGPEIFRAQEAKHRPGRDGCHVAALLVEPFRVALLRRAVTDEGQAGRAQSDQLMSRSEEHTSELQSPDHL